jgi:hypothetical protein
MRFGNRAPLAGALSIYLFRRQMVRIQRAMLVWGLCLFYRGAATAIDGRISKDAPEKWLATIADVAMDRSKRASLADFSFNRPMYFLPNNSQLSKLRRC